MLEALAEAKRFLGARLLRTVAIDRGRQDQHRYGDDEDFGNELRHGGRLAHREAQRLHAQPRREVRRHRGDESRAAEPVHRERTDSEDDDERDAPRIRGAADHPDAGGYEVRDDDVYGDLVEPERAPSPPIEPPDSRP